MTSVETVKLGSIFGVDNLSNEIIASKYKPIKKSVLVYFGGDVQVK